MNRATPLCLGKYELFDSEDVADHRMARALCERCPVLDWCRSELEKARANTLYPPKWGPRGTWAGIYIGRSGKPGVTPKRRVAACGTPSGYKRHLRMGEETCRACRDSVNAYRNEVKEAS